MNIDTDTILMAIIILLVIDALLVSRLIINKLKDEINADEFDLVTEKYIHKIIKTGDYSIPRGMSRGERYFNHIVMLDGSSVPSPLLNRHSSKKHFRNLHSVFRLKRIEAVVGLGQIGTEKVRIALEAALIKERNYPVRLYIVNALSDIGDERSIPVLVESLLGAHRWYKDKVNMLISDFGGKLLPFLPSLVEREEIEIKELLVDFTSVYFSSELKQYLFRLIDQMEEDINKLECSCSGINQRNCCCNCRWGRMKVSENQRQCKFNGVVADDYHCNKFQILFVNINIKENYEKLVYKAAEIAADLYYSDFAQDKYFYSNNNTIRNLAVTALANIKTKNSLEKLKGFLADETVASSALSAISKLSNENSSYINVITEYFEKEKNISVKERLAEALSAKIEYFIMKLQTSEQQKASEIIQEIILLGRTSAVIGFLNKNKDIEIENTLVKIIKSAVSLNPEISKEFCTYLNERIIKKTNLIKCEKVSKKITQKKDAGITKGLYFLLIAVLLVFPLIYVFRHFQMISIWSLTFQLTTYVMDFNYYLAFYSAVINIIYLLLLLLSRINVSKQSKLWSYKSKKMLFKKRMLPSVSIIAPAFNEEKIIVESANSLLNLTYPDYELIIVNDGSRDNTLNTLIEHFNLTRMDYVFNKKLSTEPIRGVYVNPSLPKLIVVDKENGGKADSLNAGIMISNNEYFCCIDSDSLLEEDALLKLASQTLDEGIETPALGGNVYPINDCKVDQGHISKIKLPDNRLARFQTIEYIRAFMAGRLGWAYINSLLIISGAFGLFRKERVIAVGGYLTRNEKYKKDTVGEDMELVVRISRMMRENKQKYRINYCYNANCWTEVPERTENLKKQRYRWHRGLIEILHFHRKTLFNYRYGRMGIVSMPYFFLFETIGPLIEVQGYLMVIAAFLLGILNWQIALLLFTTSIMLGVLVSISSLIIAEKENVYYGYADILKLVFYAFIENFGVRQYFSLWRVIGYFKMFSKPQGWGTQVRKGFANK